MKPTRVELEDPEHFELVDENRHDAVHAWVRRHLFALTWVLVIYWMFNALALAAIYWAWRGSGLPLLEAVLAVCLGMVLCYPVLVPMHEHVHAVAYRLMGASDVRVLYDLRHATALCVAPGEVLSAPEFLFVVFLPPSQSVPCWRFWLPSHHPGPSPSASPEVCSCTLVRAAATWHWSATCGRDGDRGCLRLTMRRNLGRPSIGPRPTPAPDASTFAPSFLSLHASLPAP